MSDLPSQTDFGFLSVVDVQPVLCSQDTAVAMDLESVSRSGSSNSDKTERLNQDDYVPENYFSPEVYALLAAAEAAAARRADALDASDIEPVLMGLGSSLQAQNATPIGWCYPVSSTAPPKRYYTIFWRSISLRLLDRRSHAAPSPSGANLCPTEED